MIDTTAQIQHSEIFIAEDAPDKIFAEFKNNQHFRLRITRIPGTYGPSIEQNGLLFACLKLVVDNSRTHLTSTLDLAKMSCKIGIGFIDHSLVFVRPDGGVQFSYRSFAFDKLKGKERDDVMEKAFNWCAETLGMTVGEMVKEAKSRMQRKTLRRKNNGNFSG